MKLFDIFEEGLKDFKEHSPLILAGVACVGVVATTVISIHAGKKLKEKDAIVEEKIKLKAEEKGTALTTKESLVIHVREKWPALAPVIIVGGITIISMIFSYKISAKRIVALTTALSVTTQSRDAYKKVAEKLLGEKELEREKAKAEAEEHPMSKEFEEHAKASKEQCNISNIYNGPEVWYEPNTHQYINVKGTDLVRCFEEMSYRVKSGESFVSFDEFLWALERYATNNIEHPNIAQTFGWPDERCIKGIEYRTDITWQAPNGMAVNKIAYKAYTEVTFDDCVSTY